MNAVVEWDDRYPTDGSLDALAEELDHLWQSGDIAGLKSRAIAEMAACAENCCRSYEAESDRLTFFDEPLARFSTGGWSGAEDLIATLLRRPSPGPIRFLFLEAWDRGGHWYFNWSTGDTP